MMFKSTHSRLLVILVGIDVSFLLLHLLAKRVSPLFDLDLERNLASVYASTQLVAGAALAMMIAWTQQLAGVLVKKLWMWYATALVFSYVALDEVWSIHETVGAKINTYFHLFTTPTASFNWVIFFSPLAVLAVIVLFMASRSAISLAPEVRFWFIGGLVCFVSVLLVEWGAGQWLYDSGRAVGKRRA